MKIRANLLLSSQAWRFLAPALIFAGFVRGPAPPVPSPPPFESRGASWRACAAAPLLRSSLMPKRPSSGRTAKRFAHNDGPAWTVPYGHEFWRRPEPRVERPEGRGENRSTPAAADLDLNEIVERVSYAIAPSVETGGGQVRAASYTARFESDGLHLSMQVGTSRCDVPGRVQRAERIDPDVRAAPDVAPLDAARTAQRAVPTT